MKGIIDILNEYFVPTVNGKTEQEKLHTAYGQMINFLYDMQETTEAEGFDVDDLDSLFDESMMEEYGYNYIVDDDYVYNNAEEAAEKVIDLCGNNLSRLSFNNILERIEDLGCDDNAFINGICVSTQRNW